jgi:hypothetical protein
MQCAVRKQKFAVATKMHHTVIVFDVLTGPKNHSYAWDVFLSADMCWNDVLQRTSAFVKTTGGYSLTLEFYCVVQLWFILLGG